MEWLEMGKKKHGENGDEGDWNGGCVLTSSQHGALQFV